MFFCENCGTRLRSGVMFCEECGFAVPEYAQAQVHCCGIVEGEVFGKSDWVSIWQRNLSQCEEDGVESGIILMNTYACPDTRRLEEVLKRFVLFKEVRGVRYVCLDLATEVVCNSKGNPNIESVLQVLKQVYRVGTPEYLLIVGDVQTVGGMTWENETHDGDPYVCSDLPYLTLDLTSPWESRGFHLSGAVLTGRIPSSAENGFQEACAYFENYIQFKEPSDTVQSFGLSALAWKDVSEEIYSYLGTKLLLSPDIVVQDFEQVGLAALNDHVEPNLLYFNLHGSDAENYWYGDSGYQHPRAFSEEGLPVRNGYVIGVEACYGAIQQNLHTYPKSILLEAIQNGCIAFVGSDTIAYGGVRKGHIVCADIMIFRFLLEVKQGKSFGEAFLSAKHKLCLADAKDDADIKTIAQFSLFGDPSGTLVTNGAIDSKSRAKSRKNVYVDVPDISSGVSMILTQVTAEIEKNMKEYVKQYHMEFKDVTPKYYQMRGTNLYQSMYTKKQGDIVQILKLYCNAKGVVEREYVSR